LVDANFDILDGLSTSAGTRSVTKVIAANDSIDKTKADYVCDGTNDEVQIQAAIDALTTGGIILLMEGNYNIGAGITGANYTNIMGMFGNDFPSNTSGTTLNLVANVTMFDFTSKHGWSIKNIRFNGNSRANYPIIKGIGGVTYLCNHFQIKECGFYNCIPALYFSQVYDCWIIDCKFGNCGNGTYPAVDIHTGTTECSNNVRFLGCHWEQTFGIGIKSVRDTGVLTNYNLVVANCKFEGDTSSNDKAAIYGYLASSHIYDNIIIRSRPNSIELLGGSNNIIHDNYFWGETTTYAISVIGTSCLIHNNIIALTSPTGDIEIKSGSYHCKVVNNLGTGTNGGAVIVDAGANTTTLLNGIKGFLIGGINANENLNLQSTSHATRGSIVNVDPVICYQPIAMYNAKGIWWFDSTNVSREILTLNASNQVAIGNAGLASGSIYMCIDGTLRQVTCGISDSGGSGYRLLRVPNA